MPDELGNPTIQDRMTKPAPAYDYVIPTEPDSAAPEDLDLTGRWAWTYAKHGWPTLLLYGIQLGAVDNGEANRCDCGKPACASPGKHPFSEAIWGPRNGLKDATTDLLIVAGWYRRIADQGRPANVGIVPPTPYAALDIDDPKHKVVDLLRAGPDQLIPVQLSGREGGGYHAFVKDVPGKSEDLPSGVTIKGGGGGYVVMTPSMHVSGTAYEVRRGGLPQRPSDALRAALGPARVVAGHEPVISITGEYALPESVATDHRYHAIRDFVASRYKRGLGRDEVWVMVRDVLATRFVEPLTEPDIRSRFDRAWSEELAERLGEPNRYADAPTEPVLLGELSRRVGTIERLPPTALLVGRIHPHRGAQTMLWGRGGVGKGAIVASWLDDLVVEGYRPLVLDYEGHEQEWRQRLEDLGGQAAIDGIQYAAPLKRPWKRGTIWQQADEIRRVIDGEGIDVVAVDSVGYAVQADPSKPEMAINYSATVEELDRPVLSLAHVAHADVTGAPYGSVFWFNGIRTGWQATAMDEDGGRILLRQRKHSDTDPVGMSIVTLDWVSGGLRGVTYAGYSMSLTDLIEEVFEADPEPKMVSEVRLLLLDDRGQGPTLAGIKSVFHRSMGPLGRFRIARKEGKVPYYASAKWPPK